MLYYEPPPQKTFRTKKKFEKNQNFLLTNTCDRGRVIKLSPRQRVCTLKIKQCKNAKWKHFAAYANKHQKRVLERQKDANNYSFES